MNWSEIFVYAIVCYLFVLASACCLGCLKLKNKIFYPERAAEQIAGAEEAKLSAEERKERECPICFEEMVAKKAVALCSHAFCCSCVQALI